MNKRYPEIGRDRMPSESILPSKNLDQKKAKRELGVKSEGSAPVTEH
ncbi:hypothetical protein GPU89_19985 [Burkholderia cepacia]|nr:hypothetical protein [Burkholderia cepacia]